jgi:hypothetical protein
MKNFKRWLLGSTLVVMLSVMLACTVPAWFVTADNYVMDAIPIAASVVDFVDPALAPVVTLVVNGLKALNGALASYEAQPTATALQSVVAALNAVEANEAQLEAAAQIKNPNTDKTVTEVINLLDECVTEVVALVPSNAPVGARLRYKVTQAKAQAKGWSPLDCEKEFNAIIKGDPRFKGKAFKIGILHKL